MPDQSKIDKRLKALADARSIHEQAEKEKRVMTEEEDANYTRYMGDVHDIGESLKRDAELEKFDRELDKPTEKEERDEQKPDEKKETPEDLEHRFNEAYFCDNRAVMQSEEMRGLLKDSNVDGGYWLAPEVMTNRFIKAVDDQVHIRAKATKLKLAAGHSITAPSRDTAMSDASWTNELNVATADTSYKIGKRALTPHPLSKLVKVSKDLLAYVSGVEGIVNAEIARTNAEAEENAYMTGTGAQQPLGVFVASALGISTDRDVSTGNTNNLVKTDGLINAKGALKSAYHGRSQWMMHRTTITQVSKLKDGIGGYLMLPGGMFGGNTDRILGIDLISSEFVPNTATTGLYVGILGDFSNYWIADAGTVSMQRLVELYAATNEIGLLTRRHVDGMPVLEEAFVRVTLT